MKNKPELLAASSLLLLISGVSAMAQSVEVISETKHDLSQPLRTMYLALSPNHTPAQPVRRIPLPPAAPGLIEDEAVQSSVGPAVAVTPGFSLDGVGQGFTGPSGTYTVGVAPPDTNGSVGDTQVVEWVNTAFAVFDKTTGNTLLGPVDGNQIWKGFGGPCELENDGDIAVLFDKAEHRWYFAQFTLGPNFGGPFGYCIAVSTTNDATGAFHRYRFPLSFFPDYPKPAVWPDAYYVSFNAFNASGTAFLGGKACAADRANILTGAAATFQCFSAGSAYGSLLPSDLDSNRPPPAGSPDYYVNFGTNSLNLWKFHVDFTTPANSTFTGPTKIPVAAFTPACSGGGVCIPQNGTSQQLDSLADRLMYRLAYRKFPRHESLVVNQSVTVTVGGVKTVGVRWYELRSPGTTPVVYQQSTYAPDATFRWMGSIAMDKLGDIALGYSASSSSVHPGIRYTGRSYNDPLNQLQAENTVLTGNGSQTGGLSRWGDYTAMSVDPTDECTFWYFNEFIPRNGSFNWKTHLASFKFPACK